MKLLVVDDFDGFRSHFPPIRWALTALRAFVLRRAEAELRRNGKQRSVVLGPESFESALAPLCAEYRSYPAEYPRTRWRELRQEAKTVFDSLETALAPLWASEEEARAWRALRSWFAHKWMARHLIARDMRRRALRELNCESELPGPGRGIYRAIGDYFERRERKTYWRRQSSQSGAVAGARKLDVLLVSSGIYSPRMLLPLTGPLRQANLDYEIVAVASDQPWPYDPTRKVEGVSWSYLFNHESRGNMARNLTAAMERGGKLASAAEKVALPGDPVEETEALRRELTIFLRHDWPQAKCLGDLFAMLLEKYRPRVMVCTKNQRVIEGAAVEAARARKIPVVFIDQQLVENAVEYLDVYPENHVVVAGPKSLEGFLAIGARREQLHPFGDTRLDGVKQTGQKTQRFFREGEFAVLGIGEVLSEYTMVEELSSFYRALAHAAKTVAGGDLLLKLHPKQDVEGYRRQSERWGLESLRSIKQANTYDLIRESDVVVAHISQVVMEALYLEKPVVIYLENVTEQKLSHHLVDIPALSPDYAAVVRTKDELVKQLEKIKNDPAYARELMEKARAFKRDYFFNNEKSSVDLTSQLISSLVHC